MGKGQFDSAYWRYDRRYSPPPTAVFDFTTTPRFEDCHTLGGDSVQRMGIRDTVETLALAAEHVYAVDRVHTAGYSGVGVGYAPRRLPVGALSGMQTIGLGYEMSGSDDGDLWAGMGRQTEEGRTEAGRLRHRISISDLVSATNTTAAAGSGSYAGIHAADIVRSAEGGSDAAEALLEMRYSSPESSPVRLHNPIRYCHLVWDRPLLRQCCERKADQNRARTIRTHLLVLLTQLSHLTHASPQCPAAHSPLPCPAIPPLPPPHRIRAAPPTPTPLPLPASAPVPAPLTRPRPRPARPLRSYTTPPTALHTFTTARPGRRQSRSCRFLYVAPALAREGGWGWG